jgi:hypothetical protein
LAPVHSLVLNPKGDFADQEVTATTEPKLSGDCGLVIKKKGSHPGLFDTMARPLMNVGGREWTTDFGLA